jgi:hypothetical protein
LKKSNTKGRGLGRGLRRLAPNLNQENVQPNIPQVISVKEQAAIAEASYQHCSNSPMIAAIVSGAYFNFNRLYVPLHARNNGIGTRLTQSLQAEIDLIGLPLLNQIHPYANSVLSYADITQWYVNRGFTRTVQEGILVYWPSNNSASRPQTKEIF